MNIRQRVHTKKWEFESYRRIVDEVVVNGNGFEIVDDIFNQAFEITLRTCSFGRGAFVFELITRRC